MTPTASALIDGFLRYRELSVTARTLARDRRALHELREHFDAEGPCLLDELTGRRLARHHGGVGLCDLAGVEVIIMGLRGFFETWLPEPERPDAALVVRRFVSWLEACRQLDACNAMSLRALTRQYGPAAPRAARPRHRPPGARRSWG